MRKSSFTFSEFESHPETVKKGSSLPLTLVKIKIVKGQT